MNEFELRDLRWLIAQVEKYEGDVLAELERLYPEGTKVRFKIRADQLNPSQGEVIGHQGGRSGTLTVKMDGGHVTRVSQSQLLQSGR